MGNQPTRDGYPPVKTEIQINNQSEELKERTPVELVPIEKLAKVLVQKSFEDDNVHGITCNVFTKYVFPKYFNLAERIYNYFLSCGPPTSRHLNQTVFKQQAEKLLTVMTDERQAELYLKMYSESSEVKSEDFHELIIAAYDIAMEHHPRGPQNCPLSLQTVLAIVNSAFHRKPQVSVTYLTHWIMEHCPRILIGLHRYVMHQLATSYRNVGKEFTEQNGGTLDLSTPVLDRELNFPEKDVEVILPVSQVWLLACSLPKLFIQPTMLHSPSTGKGLSSLDSQGFIARMLGTVCPSHWALLYSSNQHGLGANRFQYHVFNYRGPTLTFLRGEEGVEFCIAATDEWRESNHYWGQADCAVLQILPHFHVVERGSKIIYFNSSIRGYPHGIRAGSDPRTPAIDIDEQFSFVKYQGIPYPLLNVEVWGCGTLHSKEAQTEVKKWEMNQVEKQRKVKITASEWIDHPDRYLLELAGRKSYCPSNS